MKQITWDVNMTEIVQGLFGVSPEQLQMQQNQALQARAMQYAQMSPQEQATAGIYTGVSKLGGALGGMLGGVDPVQQQASKIASVLQGADQTTAEGMMNIAKRFADAGLPQQSQMAVAKAQEMAKASGALAAQGAETLLKTAQAGAIPSETTYRLAQAKKAGFDQLSEEQAQAAAKAALQEQGNMSDVQIEAIVKNPKSRESYFGYIADKTQITDAGGRVLLVNKENGKIIKDLGAAPEKGTKVSVNVDAKGEAAFASKLGELDAKRVGDAMTTRETATSAVTSLNKLASLPANQLITGQFATGRVGVTNLLTTLGLASPADTERLATSQQYQKVAGDVILQTLGGKLGSGFSNADREFIAALVPQLETNPEARRKLITFMQNKNQDIIQETIRLEEYARQNKGLRGFQPKIPLSVTPSKANPYADLSDAELEARIKAAQGRK